MFELDKKEDGASKGNGFLAQATILAAAGIISRVIGLLYRSPLFHVIGDLGMGYYQAAYVFYTIVLLISSYSIPSAISKVIAQKLAVQEYRNAHRLFRGALVYVLLIGGIASLFLFFGAGLFVEPAAIPVLQTLAPTIFVYGMLGVLRGYFQAHKTMLQTSVSQILEQIVNAVVSVGGAWFLITKAMGSLEVPSDEGSMISRAVYGAMGSALGTGCGVAAALIFMVWIYLKNRPTIMARIEADSHTEVEPYGKIFQSILAIVTPFILSTAIYNLSTPINTKIYTDFYPAFFKLDQVKISSQYGIFSGSAMVISNIPIAFASAMASAMIPSIAQLVAAKKTQVACEKIQIAVKATMLISIPSAVGLFALAGPVTVLLFPSLAPNMKYAAGLLMALALSVVFYALSTLNSSILQGLGKVNTPIVNAGIALVIQTVSAVFFLFFVKLDIYGIAIASTLYSLVMAYLNQRAVRKAVGYQQEMKHTFILPGIASAVMGGCAYGVYTFLHSALQLSIRVSVIPAIIVAIPVYGLVLLKIGGLTQEELLDLPKGKKLLRVLQKLHLV